MQARIILFTLCISLLTFGQADAAPKKKKKNSVKEQAVVEILEMLKMEQEEKEALEAQLAEEEAKRAKEAEQARFYDPRPTPVQVAPRAVPEIKEETYKPNRRNRGGIGHVGGLGKVGSKNVSTF